FISIIAVLISPILFALSFNLMEIIQSLGDKLSSSSSSGFGITIGDNKVNPEDFVIFSKLSVVIISGISALIIGDLREGNIKAGMKYVFLFIPISFFVYLIALTLLSGVFGVI
ncbi:MAG: hypothetical protein NDI94_02610, partial [Candidatus Woesearchaeota archaeon]|nr:hypothetical protein [Candidatus Woesearchaeota archaeon]